MLTAFILPALAALGASTFAFLETQTAEEEDTTALDPSNGHEGNCILPIEGIALGTDGTDTLVGGANSDQISGGNSADMIFGGGGIDIINGDNGPDQISGGGGHDEVFGGKGADKISGGKGNDWLFGGDGGDTIIGDQGVDTLHGENGNDLLNGGSGRDVLFGGADDDTLYGGSGKDVLYGEAGDDILEDGLGKNMLDGGSGDDWLIGTLRSDLEDDLAAMAQHTDADTLVGGDGNDILVGDNGDSMTGGAGDDDFWVNQMSTLGEATEQVFDAVVIEDFDLAESILLRDAAGVALTSEQVVGGLVISSAGDDDADTVLNYLGQDTVLLRGVDADVLAADLSWLTNLEEQATA